MHFLRNARLRFLLRIFLHPRDERSELGRGEFTDQLVHTGSELTIADSPTKEVGETIQASATSCPEGLSSAVSPFHSTGGALSASKERPDSTIGRRECSHFGK